MTALGTFIRAQLVIKDWDQQRLALEANLPASTISNVINKEGKFQLETYVALADALDVDLRLLLELGGYHLHRGNRASARRHSLAAILEAAPWMAQMVEDLVVLPPEEQEAVHAYLQYQLQRRRGSQTE